MIDLFQSSIYRVLFLVLVLTLPSNILYSQDDYNFLVAGHAYGSHLASNDGLHPAFLEDLQEFIPDNEEEFIVLNGDMVRDATSLQFETIAAELEDLDLESYYVMGNHDNNSIGEAVFEEKHGGTYYSFMHGEDLFIMLDQEISFRSISDDQLLFLEEQLSSNEYRHVFLFFHMLLWNGDSKYIDVESNLGSQYNLMSPYSNYWDEVHPILNTYCNHEIYVITGDVGGRPEVISAYYDRCGHIRMIATGMGEAPEENFMEVVVTESSVEFNLFLLNEDLSLPPLEENTYTIPVVFDMSPNGEIVICNGQSVNLEASMTDVFPYAWTFDEQDLEINDLNLEISEEGEYSFTVDDGTCYASQKANLVVIFDVPIPSISLQDTVLISDCGQGNQWYFNGEIIEGATDASYYPQSTGNYSVECSIGECVSPMSDIYYFEDLSVSGIESALGMRIFPNPSRGHIQLEISSELIGSSVKIFSAQGKLLEEKVLTNDINSISFNYQGLVFIQLLRDDIQITEPVLFR